MKTKDIVDFTERQALVHCCTNFVHKGFNCYMIETDEGTQLLIYGNERLVKYLQERNFPKFNNMEDLKRQYEMWCNNHIFTLDECMACKDYDDYQRKNEYLRDLYPLWWDSVSLFFDEYDLEEYPYFSTVCYYFFKDKEIVESLDYVYNKLKECWKELFDRDDEMFKQALREEMFNYETSYTCDYSEALDELGIREDELSVSRKAILHDEFNKICCY